eukprot:jgi/Mesen1/5205/ME000258S04305
MALLAAVDMSSSLCSSLRSIKLTKELAGIIVGPQQPVHYKSKQIRTRARGADSRPLAMTCRNASVGCSLGHPFHSVKRRVSSTILCRSSSAGPTTHETSVDAGDNVENSVRTLRIKPLELTAEAFAPFGQIVGPSEDGVEYGPQDAELDLSQGLPRFYIMRLREKPLAFDCITHHASVTQCLGSVGARPWYLAVAAPSILPASSAAQPGRQVSRAGHAYVPPRPEDVAVFRIDGPAFLKLHAATWHAGPMFADPLMDFYNLELADTNVVDHTTHVFRTADGVAFQIDTEI